MRICVIELSSESFRQADTFYWPHISGMIAMDCTFKAQIKATLDVSYIKTRNAEGRLPIYHLPEKRR